ncbi:MAG TPA: helix-turn-helix domain-containing protein [Polyangiaceae bacterium]|nr:helix-turn-helix domain-containing protein [Polyangiaceae bacterium]
MVTHSVERWLTVGEVAERLHVSTATVYSLCKRGELQHLRVSNGIRVSEAMLRALIKN